MVEPVVVPRDASEEDVARIGADLEALLCTLSDEVDGVAPAGPRGEPRRSVGPADAGGRGGG